MAKKKSRETENAKQSPEIEAKPEPLRIIGGTLRGSKLEYLGDPRTRPMKNRVREAVFNLLGATVKNRFAIDLFGGTGALGLEAVSRGAVGALFVERHFPTAKVIESNAAAIGIGDKCRVVPGSAFVWARRPDAPTDQPWITFCSPPYSFFVEKRDEMLDLITRMLAAAPPDSVMVVEADDNFDFADLPRADEWDVRVYLPAVVGLLCEMHYDECIDDT